VTVRRTEVSSNSGGGVDVSGGSQVRLENVFVVANGTGVSMFGGAKVVDSQVEWVYVTMAANTASGEDSVQCVGGISGSIRNSLFFGTAINSVDIAGCGGLTFEGNASDTDLGGGNTNAGMLDVSWFVNPGSNDFHLAPGHPFGGVATWKDGDPLVDYDGDARPGMDGAADVAGADVPQ